MRRENIDDEIERLAFDFFYWFSRFEFALKAQKEFRKKSSSGHAQPNWDQFVKRFKDEFDVDDNSNEMMKLSPKRQVVDGGGELSWNEVGRDGKSDLDVVVTLLKTVRNNLFHGGKQGAGDWDDNERNRLLLKHGKLILDQFANLADVKEDYSRYY